MVQGVLEEYADFLYSFARRSLNPYLSAMSQDRRHRLTAKEFNDPIWGTLLLTPLEVVILDSPLLQRLRRIRQLGVVHFVYPAAGHSRLEHSIGVTQQVQRLVDATNSSPVGSHRAGPVIDDSWTRLLRLAGLVHDVGHGVMSHVSENALIYFEDVESIQLEFEDEVARVALGELNSYYLLGSPAFGELLDLSMSLVGVQLPDSAQGILQRMVVGQPVRDDIPYIQELISGPFDADKLDYMTRDARMAGVPEATDINRLLRKIRAVDVRPERLPSTYRSGAKARDTVTVVAVARSGNRTLDELTLARTLIFDKIYRHHKVRAAEAMVAAMFEQFGRVTTSSHGVAQLAMILDDDGLLRVDWTSTSIVNLIQTEDEAYEEARRIIDDLSSRLRDRRLFRRAAAFATRIPSDPYSSFQPHKSGVGEFLRAMDDSPAARRDFTADISHEVVDAIERVGAGDLLEEFPAPTLEPYIWVDPPRSMPNPTATANALLVTPDGKLIPFTDEAPETPNWALAYTQTRDVGYVFSPSTLAPYVALVVERRLRNEYGIRLPQWMLANGIARDEFDSLRRELDEAGFYESSPLTLRPTPEPLTTADFPRQRQRLARLLSGYHGPNQLREELGKEPIHPLRIENFVSQFRQDDMIDAALRMLKNLRMIGRPELASGLRQFVAGNDAFLEAHVVPLGEPKDSAGQAAYFALDAQDDVPGLRAVDLEVAIGSPKPIIFVDDYVGSGRQSSSIVRSWFGNTDEAEALGEDRRVLPPRLQQELRDHEIGFVFAAGMRDGLSHLAETAREIELQVADVHAEVLDEDIPQAFRDVTYRSQEQEEQFRELCASIGLSLMADSEAAEERKLGYGNNALLLVFPYNTPTHTLTLLWESGQYEGADWEPLLPRRKKL